MRSILFLCLVWASLFTPAVAGDDNLLLLPIGDPARKERRVDLVLDAVTDCRTGDLLTPGDLAPRLKDVRLLFIGEQHTNVDFHRVQLRVIRELHRAGRRVLIGLEMYPYTQQIHLDHWGRGLLTEEGFVDLSRWYDSWGYPWEYYRKIFLYARRNEIPLVALNTPREVIRAVREKGFGALTEEEAGRVPDRVDTDSEEHLRLFRAYFSGDDEEFHSSMSNERLRAMFDAQCTWDAAMASNAVQALESEEDPRAIMVVLIGSGHVAYGLGIQRQAAQQFEGGMASIVPIPVVDEEGVPVTKVQASYADFVWGLPPASYERFPSLGTSTVKAKESDRRRVVYVAEESIASEAGFELGDLLLTMNGIDLPDRETVNRLLAGLRWGDSAVFEVLRGDDTIRLTALFRRQRPEPCAGD